MAELFRSETMVYARMVVQDGAAAYDTVKQLGVFGKAHVVDLSQRHGVNSAPSERLQTFKKRVGACGFFERKLQNFGALFPLYKVAHPSIDIEPTPIAQGDVVDVVKAYLDPLESTLTKNVLYAREQRVALNTLLENLFVLQAVSGSGSARSKAGLGSRPGPAYGTFAAAQRAGEESSLLTAHDESDLDEEKGDSVTLRPVHPGRNLFMSTVYGIVPSDKVILFERMLFRVSRGNVVMKCTPLDAPMADPINVGQTIRKSVFSVTFVGEQLGRRIKKIVDFFGAVEYEVPEDQEAQRATMRLERQIVDAQQLLAATEAQVRGNLLGLTWDSESCTSPYINFMHALKVEKAICDIMKRCEPEREGSNLLRLEAWVPADEYPELQRHLKLAVAETGLHAAACEQLHSDAASSSGAGMPPTYFRTTKFTQPYQAIVDTYGVPRYKEVNPGLFTIISFPFLFGVMYGDVGHGTLLTLGALYFILNERYYLREARYGRMDEIMGMVFGGRYLLIAMGLFAVYAGFIYNDCFSIPLNMFGSKWSFTLGDEEPVAVWDGQVYPFGVDPSWYHTTNELAFFNSLKMKLSVTLGVTQMTFGIILSAMNHRYFGDRVALVCEFIPRLVFMMSTFGYMVFLILYKLSIDWSATNAAPPNLVQTMIAMFLSPGTVDPESQLYAGQAGVQAFLLLLALLSVPVMLLAQPLVARAQHRAIFGVDSSYTPVGENSPTSAEEAKDDEEGGHSPVVVVAVAHKEEGGHGADPRSPHYSFADHCITQGIHSIEFVLGAVSNTASYLRLWALSLAHAELSSVFWSKMISQYGLNGDSAVVLVIGMAVWGVATFAVLLAMDVLECFLHALRLHWVEFQNKFFHADGIAYRPFSYENSEVQE